MTLEELNRPFASDGPLKVMSVSADETLPSPRLLFSYINRYDAVPTARMRFGAVRADKDSWLDSVLEHLSFTNRCYMFVLGVVTQPNWQWLEAEVTGQRQWILDLMARSDVSDFMILSSDRKGFLGLIEDEAAYLAFTFGDVQELSDLAQSIKH